MNPLKIKYELVSLDFDIKFVQHFIIEIEYINHVSDLKPAL